MKTHFRLAALPLFLLLLTSPLSFLHAASTINTTNHYAYGANLGWFDWRGDVTKGAVIGPLVFSGFIYSGNVGWINLGNGAPLNGTNYQNNSALDFGVNL